MKQILELAGEFIGFMALTAMLWLPLYWIWWMSAK